MAEEIKGRNSSIELLRILSMVGVVILHYNLYYGFNSVEKGSINEAYLYIIESLFACAVNLFVMISAYFLSATQKRKFIKIVDLIIQVIAFYLLFYFIGVARGHVEFSVTSFLKNFLPTNYFVILYGALYLVSPYINILIKNLSKKNFRNLVILLVVLFSVWNILVDILGNFKGEVIDSLSTVSKYGSQNGYTIVNFVVVYFVGAYIRLNGISLSKKKSGLGILICFLAVAGFAFIEKAIGLKHKMAWNYDNPFIIFMAAFIILLFVKIEFSNKFINEIAKGTFTCFLIHSSFLPFIMIDRFINTNIFLLIIHQIGSAIAIYLVSYIIYKLYYLCSHWFTKLITPLFNKVNVSVIQE